MLCPLLLLLHQDPLLCPTLTDARRYVPLVATGAVYLGAAAVQGAAALAAAGGSVWWLVLSSK